MLNSDRFTSDLLNHTISEIIADDYNMAIIFKKYGLNFCNSGNRLLSQACEENGLNKSAVLNDLRNTNELKNVFNIYFNECELDYLSDFKENHQLS